MGRIFRRFDSPRVFDGAYVAASTAAEARLREAEAHAAAIVAEAEREAETRAHDRLAEAEVAALALLRDAARMAERIAAIREPDVVELALAVTARVVADASAIDPSLVRAEASRALASLVRARTLTLECHADDLEALSPLTVDDPRVRVEVDPSLERGDVVVRADIGRVDARLRTRLENVARALGRQG